MEARSNAAVETITIILVLLLAVVVSGVISRALPVPIPRPLVQIALGAIIGLSAGLRVDLNPEIFFLLFLPPLLFLDGWRIPKEEMLKDRAAILELAFGLVVFTVVGVGYFIDWLIPAMPFAICFALAAVLSPTDPIAVSAIAQRVPIPKRMMHILEGESLLNDASGLVCLRFAIAAALTGTFSLYEATLAFFWVASGGIAAGVGVTLATTWVKSWTGKRFGEESGSQIVISILIPFAAYLLAEHFHCSGILAAVAAGVTMSFAEEGGQTLAATRMRRNSVWDAIQFAANGIIFVLLGEQLPLIIAAAPDTVRLIGHDNLWWLLAYVAVIYAALALMRFIWVWVSLRLTIFRAKLNGTAPHRPTNWRLVAATSLAGVRGAITLAGVLTLPLTLSNGAMFPARELAIALAMGVIILSLVAASIGLPLLLKGLEMPPEPSNTAEEETARIAAGEAAIAEIERVQHGLSEGRKDADIYVATAARLMAFYRSRIDVYGDNGQDAAASRKSEEIERNMRLAAVKAERTAIFRMLRKRQISTITARKLVRELDLMEARYEG
jgi:Na+/H+ antiporter